MKTALVLLVIGAVLVLASLMNGDAQSVIGVTHYEDISSWDSSTQRIILSYSHQNRVGITECHYSDEVGFGIQDSVPKLSGVSGADCVYLGGVVDRDGLCGISAIPSNCVVDNASSYSSVDGHRGEFLRFDGGNMYFQGYCSHGSGQKWRLAQYSYHVELDCSPRMVEQSVPVQQGQFVPDEYVPPKPVVGVWMWCLVVGFIIVLVGLIIMGGRNG